MFGSYYNPNSSTGIKIHFYPAPLWIKCIHQVGEQSGWQNVREIPLDHGMSKGRASRIWTPQFFGLVHSGSKSRRSRVARSSGKGRRTHWFATPRYSLFRDCGWEKFPIRAWVGFHLLPTWSGLYVLDFLHSLINIHNLTKGIDEQGNLGNYFDTLAGQFTREGKCSQASFNWSRN